ncbi:hypothetical protein GOV07_01435 [Candidatus Woesearchaeota archaeon]|nr:hypothetical protein [Candidatus Woesearchaeota archaeon]
MKRGGSAQKRGAYFFVIDAFLAASILSFTLVLLFTLFIDEPNIEQGFVYAHDYLNFLTTTEIRDFRHDDINDLITKGHITNTRLTLSEQVLIFYEEMGVLPGREYNITMLLAAAAESLPPTIAINVSLREKPDQVWKTLLFDQPPHTDTIRMTHLTARSVEYAVKNQDQLVGPYILEVDIWS